MTNRRMLILGASAAALLPLAWPLAGPRAARAEAVPDAADRDPAQVEAAMEAGEALFVVFRADWCSTCAAQGRVIARLRAETPAYDRAVTFAFVDWDAHGSGALARALAIPRRSTLVALKGRTELGRSVAGTSEAEIRALMDLALAAAGA